MTIEVKEKLLVCVDCASWLAYEDASALDYHYDEEESDTRLIEIQEGIKVILARYGKGAQIVPGDEEEDEDYSRQSCDCCGSRLIGSRLSFSVLKDNGLSAWLSLYRNAHGVESVAVYDEPLDWQKKGLSYTASGYGQKIPTPYIIHWKGKRRRVYARCFSNVASLYIVSRGEEISVEIERK